MSHEEEEEEDLRYTQQSRSLYDATCVEAARSFARWLTQSKPMTNDQPLKGVTLRSEENHRTLSFSWKRPGSGLGKLLPKRVTLHAAHRICCDAFFDRALCSVPAPDGWEVHQFVASACMIITPCIPPP